MPLDTLLQLSVTGSVALIALAAMATANASDLTVTDAKIAGGKLVITGTTATPNTWVRLDGHTAPGAANVPEGIALHMVRYNTHPGTVE